MKKNRGKWRNIAASLSSCIIIILVMLFFDAAAEASRDSKLMEQIGNLVMKRADTMNDYYAGELEYIHAEEILRDIECGDLLNDDLDNLTIWEHTDIDTINDVDISEVVLLQESEKELSASVAVIWNVSGLNGTEQFEMTYETVCAKNGKTLKLTQFI